MRVLRPMLIPRATIQKLICGAMGLPAPGVDGPGLDGLEGVDAGLEIGAGAAPAAEAPVERLGSVVSAGWL